MAYYIVRCIISYTPWKENSFPSVPAGMITFRTSFMVCWLGHLRGHMAYHLRQIFRACCHHSRRDLCSLPACAFEALSAAISPSHGQVRGVQDTTSTA